MAKLRAQLTFRVPEDVYDWLQEFSAAEKRKMNEVARALLDRGLAAYRRDGQLFEPEAPAERPATITVPTITLGNKKERKKNTA